MATALEVQKLKNSWRADPCWDIEDTEGFEDHREELLAYSQECHDKWEAEAQQELQEKANKLGIPDNTKLAGYLTWLEKRVSDLETELHTIKFPCG